MNKDFSKSFLAPKNLKKPSLNKSSQPYVARSRPYSQTSSIRGGHSISSNDSVNFDLLLNNGEIFPEDILILLGEQERNITSFKQRIERQKMRIENDFVNFKRQMQHVMDDLKISMQAELDKIYRFFIQKYASLKSQVQEIKKIKKQIETQQVSESHYEKIIPTNSNKELIKELTKDSQNYRLYKIQNYIVQLQKKKINPLLELSKELILLETSNRSYYETDSVTQEFGTLKQQIGHFTSHMFSNLGKYIVNPLAYFQQNLASEISILSDKRQEPFENLPLKQVQHRDFSQKQFYAPRQFDKMDIRNAREHRGNSKESRDPREPRDPRDYLDQNNFVRPEVPPLITKSVYNSPEGQKYRARQFEQNYGPRVAPHTQPFQYSHSSSPSPSIQPPKRFRISQSQQIISFPWVEDIKLRPSTTIHPQHSTILCASIINNTYVVTGGKDSLIYVFTLDGMKIATLKAHTASVCTLSTISNSEGKTTMLVSGSDVGCSTLIFWDINSWTIKSKIHAHSAAITSIVDLKDGQTLVSGSYDKMINIYNHRRAEVLYNLSSNKSRVTAIVLSSDGSRMTSCGLDKSLYVWKISRRHGIVQTIELDRIIQNDDMICSLNTLTLRSEIIVTGTKDGRIKFWNLDNGECEKTLTANNSAIIELVVVERQSKPNHPLILSCSSKDRSLVLTNTENLINSLFDVDDKLNIELGCGIGPKIIFDRLKGVPIIALVSQSSERREVNIFQMETK